MNGCIFLFSRKTGVKIFPFLTFFGNLGRQHVQAEATGLSDEHPLKYEVV